MKILITGASGLLGSKLAELATHSGHEVYSLYYSHICTLGNPVKADITNRVGLLKIFADTGPEVVIHTASVTDVDLCESNPELAVKVNSEGTSSVSKACEETRSYLIYVSTDYVFDGTRGDYSETDQPNPINVYGKSKLRGEQEVTRSCPQGCIARSSVIYGWGRSYRANFATWVYSRLKANERTRVVTDQFASPTLNSHLARMLLEVAERRISGTLHLAGSTRISRFEFAAKLAKRIGLDQNLLIPVQADASGWRAKRPRDSSLNVSKARGLLANKPITLDEGLDEFGRDQPRGV